MADDSMPPLGPPYGPPGPPPPPRFPRQPPLEWGARPIEPLPEPPSSPRGPRRGVVALAVVVAAALLAAGVAVWSRDDSGPTARPRRSTTTTTGPPSSDSTPSATDSTDPASSSPGDLLAVVADIKSFVEKERGLSYKADVPVVLASESQFLADLTTELAEEIPLYHEQEQVLKALQLLPRADDLVTDVKSLLGAGVLGFYNPKTKKLEVRGEDPTPFVRQILAHELTHALDDQWFNLDRPGLDTADDETSVAFSALAEGDARNVENAYVDKVLTSSEQQQAKKEELATAAPFEAKIFSLPPILVALLQFPYDAGVSLVGRILDAGGNERLDSAFGNPPTTSEQVLEPDKYLSGEAPRALTEPVPDGGPPVANRGMLGALLLNQLLQSGQSYDATRLDPALAGWGGDRYVTWLDGDRACIKDVVVGDDAPATTKLLQRFQDFAAAPGVNATVAPLSPDPGAAFTIVSCS